MHTRAHTHIHTEDCDNVVSSWLLGLQVSTHTFHIQKHKLKSTFQRTVTKGGVQVDLFLHIDGRCKELYTLSKSRESSKAPQLVVSGQTSSAVVKSTWFVVNPLSFQTNLVTRAE